MKDVLLIGEVKFQVVMHALIAKGIIDYADVQNAVSVVREGIPKEHYSPVIARTLDAIEQTYQHGRFELPPFDPNDR